MNVREPKATLVHVLEGTDVELDVGRRMLDVLLDKSGLGMGSRVSLECRWMYVIRESIECRWMYVMVQLELELVEAGRRESLECR